MRPHLIEIGAMLTKNKSRKKPPSEKRYPYILTGLLTCEKCGDRLCGKSAHGNGGKIGYYEHAWSTKTQSCLSKKTFACEPHRVLAKKIEPVVWEDVKKLLTDPEYARMIFEEAKSKSENFSKKAEIEKIKAKLASLENQIEATTERVSELPKGVNAKTFYDQILKLQKTKEDYELNLSAAFAEEQNHDTALSLDGFKRFTEDLKKLAARTEDPEVQASICRKLIEQVDVSTTGITIHYHVGDIHYQNVFIDKKRVCIQTSDNDGKSSRKGSAGEKPAGPFFISRPLRKYQKNSRSGISPAGFKTASVIGSNSLTNGRGCRT